MESTYAPNNSARTRDAVLPPLGEPDHARLELSPSQHTVATAQYIALVQEIGRELGYKTGWQGEAARRVGISHSLLSQILRGRKVTRGTLEKALISMRLSPHYFGSAEAVREVPPSDVAPRAPDAHLTVDPLLVLEGFKALPSDTRKRLLVLMRAIEPNGNGH